ncbi:aldehyde dehydrogenase [Sinomonas atrocyanea]|uniref:aldehyde dehydrogenase (NADP(+)) n=1 Tax=Sinomonas atrocyanea TaxID=37927 RepID=UPI0011435C31|nr:aldehyde dehydrogenase (NADP(+)) [Sinomonas atrocyanea]GEB64210.1 aldehyde dehydrogenase [Sinomonas atrocyanea]GGG57259.1 aldehyde dehydrogenase [Sinomonas atrocyanea]
MNTTIEQLEEKVRAAHDAYRLARGVPPQARAGWLESVAASLEENADELVRIADEDTHLGEARLQGELRRTVFQLRLLGAEIVAGEPLEATIDHADPSWGMGPRPDLRRVNVPLGVVGVFGASNFPFAFSVIGGDSASALAAGCAVVHKIHTGHRRLGHRTAEIVIGALAAAGAPEALFSTVTGREAAEALVDHPVVKAIGFTGSTAGGRALFDRAARRAAPIPFYGELGSINPVFVTEKAWQERRDSILTEYAASFTLGMGQFCTKPGLLFAPETEPDDLVAALAPALEGHAPALLLTPSLRDGFGDAVAALQATEGVDVLIAGSDDEAPRPTLLRTTAERVRQNPRILEQEMFGPATLIVSYRPGTDLCELASLLDGQLTATVHAEPQEDPADLVAVLAERSGRLLWNGWPTGVSVTYAQHHGGPYPATTAPNATSVGTGAIRRFMRPVAYQSFPPEKLPAPLQDENPWKISRRVNGQWERAERRQDDAATAVSAGI